MTNLSVEEVLAKYVVVFGDIDGPVVANLTDKVSNLAHNWNLFLYLFCGPQQRVSVLNKASGSTAKLLQGLLWDNVLMRIRQLTDPASSGSGDNLSLEHLVRIALRVSTCDLSKHYAATKDACRGSRTYATKYLAHLDLGHSIGQKKSSVTRGQTTEAITAICKFVQEFHLQVRGVSRAMLPIANPDGVEQFLLRLHQGNQAEESLEAAAMAAAQRGDWDQLNRRDIPEWIPEDRDLFDLFDARVKPF